jgi:hypothetical protein
MTSQNRIKQLKIVFSITALIVGMMGILLEFSVRWDFFVIFSILAIAALLLKGIKRCPLRMDKNFISLGTPNLPTH